MRQLWVRLPVPYVLYECHDVIYYPLYIFYMKSLSLGILPTDWKLAEVTAVYKKGSKSDRGNYRPVSLTSVCCKIFEQLIRDDLMAHLLGNDLIRNRQYGFVKSRSTSLQLLQILDKWIDCLDNGGWIDAVYTDFEKAFDKVPRDIID